MVIRFSGELLEARGGGHAIAVDDDLAASIGLKHMTRVKGTLNGRPYRSSVAKMGGALVLGVHKANVEALGLACGDLVKVTMAPDAEPREGDVAPDFLREAIGRNAGASAAWEKLAPSHRREFIGYVTEAKKEETRVRRIQKVVDDLAARDAKR